MTDEPLPKGWNGTCSCGTHTCIQNAAFVLIGPGCEHCRPWLDGIDLDDPADGLVAMELGWCGCGAPWEVDEWMAEYLRKMEAHDWNDDDRSTVLLAYIADDLRWTEHGGSVRCSWLTDDGKTALANLTAHLARPEDTRP